MCPETWVWFNSPESRFNNWFFEVPAESWSNFTAVIFGITFFAMTSGMALPAVFSDLLLSPQQPWLWTGIYAVLGVIIAILSRRRLTVSILGLLAAIGLVDSSFVYLFSIWGADGYDLGRHIYPFIPFVGIALLALIPTVSESQVNSQQLNADTQLLPSESN